MNAVTTVRPRISNQAGLVSLPAATYACVGRVTASMNANTFTARSAKKAISATIDSNWNTTAPA